MIKIKKMIGVMPLAAVLVPAIALHGLASPAQADGTPPWSGSSVTTVPRVMRDFYCGGLTLPDCDDNFKAKCIAAKGVYRDLTHIPVPEGGRPYGACFTPSGL